MYCVQHTMHSVKLTVCTATTVGILGGLLKKGNGCFHQLLIAESLERNTPWLKWTFPAIHENQNEYIMHFAMQPQAAKLEICLD